MYLDPNIPEIHERLNALEKLSGPAPKEERMDSPKRTVCSKCKNVAFEENGELWCPTCSNRRQEYAESLRAVYDKAYFAKAASGVWADVCREFALETVRQWPAMQAELNALIGEMG